MRREVPGTPPELATFSEEELEWLVSPGGRATVAGAAHPRPSGGAYAAPWSPSVELEAEPGESVQLISVRSFLEAPVRTRYHAMGLFEKVRELRRVVALTTEDEASDVVLCLSSRVLLDDYSLEESGVSEDSVVLAMFIRSSLKTFSSLLLSLADFSRASLAAAEAFLHPAMMV